MTYPSRNRLIVLALIFGLMGCSSTLKTYRTDTIVDYKDCENLIGTAYLIDGVNCNYPLSPDRESDGTKDNVKFITVELDDYGEFRERIQVNDALKSVRQSSYDEPTILLVYIHGWRNDASEQSVDLKSFRNLVFDTASNPCAIKGQTTKTEAIIVNHTNISANSNSNCIIKNVVGIYVGWRGDPLGLQKRWKNAATEALQSFTFWNRLDAAKNIADTNITNFMLKLSENLKTGDTKRIRESRNNNSITSTSCTYESFALTENLCSLSIVIGHSLGGRVLEHTIAQALLGSRFLASKVEIGERIKQGAESAFSLEKQRINLTQQSKSLSSLNQALSAQLVTVKEVNDRLEQTTANLKSAIKDQEIILKGSEEREKAWNRLKDNHVRNVNIYVNHYDEILRHETNNICSIAKLLQNSINSYSKNKINWFKSKNLYLCKLGHESDVSKQWSSLNNADFKLSGLRMNEVMSILCKRLNRLFEKRSLLSIYDRVNDLEKPGITNECKNETDGIEPSSTFEYFTSEHESVIDQIDVLLKTVNDANLFDSKLKNAHTELQEQFIPNLENEIAAISKLVTPSKFSLQGAGEGLGNLLDRNAKNNRWHSLFLAELRFNLDPKRNGYFDFTSSYFQANNSANVISFVRQQNGNISKIVENNRSIFDFLIMTPELEKSKEILDELNNEIALTEENHTNSKAQADRLNVASTIATNQIKQIESQVESDKSRFISEVNALEVLLESSLRPPFDLALMINPATDAITSRMFSNAICDDNINGLLAEFSIPSSPWLVSIASQEDNAIGFWYRVASGVASIFGNSLDSNNARLGAFTEKCGGYKLADNISQEDLYRTPGPFIEELRTHKVSNEGEISSLHRNIDAAACFENEKRAHLTIIDGLRHGREIQNNQSDINSTNICKDYIGHYNSLQTKGNNTGEHLWMKPISNQNKEGAQSDYWIFEVPESLIPNHNEIFTYEMGKLIQALLFAQTDLGKLCREKAGTGRFLEICELIEKKQIELRL